MENAKEKIELYMEQMKRQYGDVKPIFEIMVFEKPDAELVYPTGKHSGFPDTGAQDTVGYYYDLQDAIDVFHENACDIRECVYDAGFLICRYPGCYNAVDRDGRIYFRWDEDRQGFFEEVEPVIFRHVAY